MFIKYCPKCGCKQIYTTKGNLNRAIKANTLCSKCRMVDHNRELNTRLFEKECIDCGEKYIGKYKNLRCFKCDRIMRTKWSVKTFERTLRKNTRELEISSKDMMFYGKPFLLENTNILELCQIREKINKIIYKNYYNNNNRKKKKINEKYKRIKRRDG